MSNSRLVNLNEFERDLTNKDREDLVAMVRKLMHYHFRLLTEISDNTDHELKIEQYQNKMNDGAWAEYHRRKVLRTSNPMPFNKVERMWVITLTADAYVAAVNMMAMGEIHRLIKSPFDVYRPLITETAKRIVVLHTHPSEPYAKPANTDMTLVKQLLRTLKPMDIRLEDYIVLGRNDFYSFTSNQLLTTLEYELTVETGEEEQWKTLENEDQQRLKEAEFFLKREFEAKNRALQERDAAWVKIHELENQLKNLADDTEEWR